MNDSREFPDRRQFLKSIGLTAAGVALAGSRPALAKSSEMLVPRRKFGRHDVEISSLGIGGHTLASSSNQDEANRIVEEAIAAGINFMDNAWDYHGGRAEEVMGAALKGKRDKVFLMTKVCTHGKGDKKDAMRMLEESLKRLGTDHLDLWQLHAVASMDQVEHAFREGSVLQAMEEAKKQGKTRFIGFTGHTEPDVHVAMLSRKFPFDSCQMPLSPIDANSDAFQRKVLPELVKQKIAPLAMKTLLGNAGPVRDGVMTVAEALRYTLSLPVATIISGIKSVEHLRENVRIAAEFKPMPHAEMLALETRVRPASLDRKYEPYRKWMAYRDGDSQHYV